MEEEKKSRINRKIKRPKRTETISIKVNEDEYNRFYAGASNAGMSMSEFIRSRVLNSIEKEEHL